MGSQHVFEDRRNEDGNYRYTAAYLNTDGCLVIETHDMGPVVGRVFGSGLSEYEAVETFDPEQTARFPTSSRGLTEHAESIGVGRGKVWNRIGD